MTDDFNTSKLTYAFKDCFKTLLILILSIVSSCVIFFSLNELILGSPPSPYSGSKLFGLVVALTAAGYIATHAKLKISRFSTFILLALPSLLFCAVAIGTNSMIASAMVVITPFLIRKPLIKQEIDYLSLGLSVIKMRLKNGPRFLKTKAIRGFVFGYVVWIIALILTNNFEFSSILEFEYYDEARGRFLMLLPFILAAIFVPLWKWYNRGE